MQHKTHILGLTYWELLLWTISALTVLLAFCLFDRSNYLNLGASLVGVTSLILIAKGHPLGQILTLVFSMLYGYISFKCAYYGEMITYVFMTAPMALLALISWLRHPYQGNHQEVEVNHIRPRELPLMFGLTIAVSIVFCPILAYFHTANLIPSTISIATSFLAIYLTFRRSPYYALAYAANDIVLITLWILASIQDISYLSVVACFAAFLINDLYGFIAWRRMSHRQSIKKGL